MRVAGNVGGSMGLLICARVMTFFEAVDAFQSITILRFCYIH